MKRIIHYLAVILLSMTLASCPNEMWPPTLYIDNQSNRYIEVGALFDSEYRKQKIKEDYGLDVPSLKYYIWQILPKYKCYQTLEFIGYDEDWGSYFASLGIDTLTIVVAVGESGVSQWIESRVDSLLLFRKDFTLETIGAANNNLDICIDSSLQVTMKSTKDKF